MAYDISSASMVAFLFALFFKTLLSEENSGKVSKKIVSQFLFLRIYLIVVSGSCSE